MTILTFIRNFEPECSVSNLKKVTVNGVSTPASRLASMPLQPGMRVEYAPIRKGGSYTTLVAPAVIG